MSPENLKLMVPLAFFILVFLLQSIKPLFVQNRIQLKHDVTNLSLFVFNTALLALLFTRVNGSVLEKSFGNPYSILNILQIEGIAALLVSILLFDLWMYWWHRWTHTSKFLWRFHRMHHSDPAMNVTTAMRFHTGELLISSVLRLLMFFFIGMNLFVLLIYETIMMPVIYLQHSNWYFPESADRVYRLVFASPWMHWVHHSDYQPETDSNYGTIFSFWDRLFKSYRIKENPLLIHYGLAEFTDLKWQTLKGLFRTPWV